MFTSASGSWIRDENGRDYLDFFAGAGALNYGHNNPVLKSALVDYIMNDGITHGLDMSTVAKREFLETFQRNILEPRGLDYKVQFPGPTGSNTVEAALKLARKVTGRSAVINFTNAFHGMTLGALSVTGNSMKRAGAGVPLVHTTPMPFDNYFDGVTEDFQWFSRVLDDSGSGINRPAAVIVETVQGEGGVNVARPEWLRALATLCSDRGILLIVDDVQMGCGRTGPFFSFEEAGIVPDIVTLSKSISGYGMPMALTLFKRELDVWGPGEHNGTFRGNNPAFVTSKVALDHYWSDDALTKTTLKKGARISECFANLSDQFPRRGLAPRAWLGSGPRLRTARARRQGLPVGIRRGIARRDLRTLRPGCETASRTDDYRRRARARPLHPGRGDTQGLQLEEGLSHDRSHHHRDHRHRPRHHE